MPEDLRSGRSTDPLCRAFAHTAAVRAIDVADVDTMLAGFRVDLTVSEYAAWGDLRSYIHAIDGTAGRMFLKVLEPVDPRAEEVTTALEEAVQLTGMPRDVVEDVRTDRVYPPAEDLKRFGVTQDDLHAVKATPQLRGLVAFEVHRARELFTNGVEVLSMVRPGSRPCLWAITEIHRTLLTEIERRDYDVFARRVALSARRRTAIACRAAAGRSPAPGPPRPGQVGPGRARNRAQRSGHAAPDQKSRTAAGSRTRPRFPPRDPARLGTGSHELARQPESAWIPPQPG
jgi:phytoene synthase